MRLWGRWIDHRRTDNCTCGPRTPRLRTAVGSIWECRHGQRWVLRSNYLDGYVQRYRWEAALDAAQTGEPT